jgi:anti-anti-sigma factor
LWKRNVEQTLLKESLMSESQPSCSRGAIRGNVLVVDVLTEQIRDPDTSYALRDEILSLMKAGEVDHVVLNLQHVTFLGSVGLLAFLAVRRQLEGGSVVLCNLSQGIEAMLQVCMLISKDPAKTAPFTMEPSVESALAKLGD